MKTMTRKRRVSPLTREKARARMLALSPEEKARRLAAMREGRAKSRGPEALAKVNEQIETLNDEFKSLDRGHPRRLEIMREIEVLGKRRYSLEWGGSE